MGAGWFWAAGEARAKAALTNKAERKEAEAKKNAKAAKENEDRANRKVSEAIDAKKQTQRILAKSFTKEGTIAFENWDLPRALLFLVSAGVSDEQPIINRMLHKTISRIETHSGSWLAHTSEISSISTSSTGKFIVTTDIAGGVRLWDENTLELAYSLDKQTAESTAICFDQSDKICIVGSLSGELWYYQLLEDGDYDATNLRFHFDRINSISVTNKEQILVASSDRHVSVWEKKSRKLVDKRPHENPVVAAYWLPDGGVASFAKNGNLHLGDLGQKPKIIDLSTNINFVIKTGDEFLVVGTRGGIHLLDNQGNVLDQARPYRSNSIVGVNDWNANLQTVVFSDQSGRVYRAQVRSEKSSGKTYLETKEISIPTQQADPSITGLALNDDRELHIAYANGEMLTRLLHEESIRLKISTHDELSSVASSRGKVFTGNTEGSISIYQPPDQWPHETTLLGKDVRVNEMAISPDHKYAAIAATSGNVFLVRLADRQFTELNHSPEEESWVNSVLFTTDSKQLITADHQSLAVWDIASKQQTKSFNPDLSQLKQETQPYSKPPLIKDVVWSEVDKSVFILHRTGDIYRRGDTENRPATTGWHEIDIVDQTVLRKAPHFISGNGQKLIHSPNSKLMAIKRHQKIQIVRVNSGDYSSNQAATVVDAANQQTLIAVGDLKGRISLTNTGSDFDTSWTASDKPIEFLKFLLSKSGQELIFTADQDGVGKLWDRENLVAVYNPPENKAGRITAVSGSEDGSVIVIGRSNGSIEIFQTDSGVRIARFSPHRESITSVLIAGELIVGASKDGNFFTSNIAGVNSADAMTKFLSYPFQYEALSSDEKRAWENVFANSKKQQKSQLLMLAAKPNESPSKLAALLVKETGEFLTKGPGLFVQSIINRLKGVDQVVLTNHRTEARAALSSDEATVCTYSEDGIIEFWKNDNSKLQNLNSHDLGYVIWEAKFSDDGSFLVTRGFNSELAIFASDGRRLPDLMGHRGRIGRISWEKGSRRLISGSRDQTARIWDLGSKSAASTVLKGHTDYVTSVALSKNRAVTGAQNGELWLWNIKNAKCMQRLEESDGVKDWAPVRGMTISRDKKAVFTGHENGTLRKWELVSGSLLLQCKLNSKGQVIELARDVEQSHKASKETETKNLVLLKTEELESEFKKIETKISTVDKSPKEETLPIEGVSLRSKSDEIVVIFRGGSVVLTFADSDFTSPLQTMGHDTELFGDTSISGDGNTLTTASKTGEEYVWRLDTGGLVAKSFVHDKFKLPGALSVDGQTLVSGGENGSVFVSDVAKMHRPKGYFKPLPSFDRGLVSSNSKTVVYLAEDRVRFAQRQEDSAKVKTHSFQDFEANGSVVDAVISADGNHASIFESGRVVFYSLDDRAWQQKAEHNFVSLNVSDGKVFSYTELEEDEELIELQLNEDFTLVDPKRVEFIKGEESGKSKSWLILTRQKVLVRATVQEDKTIELNFLGSEVQDAAIAENGTLAWIDDQGIHCGQKFAEPVWSDQKFSATRLVWSRDSDQLIAADESGDFIFFKPIIMTKLKFL
jgi:WD40 repeat protein